MKKYLVIVLKTGVRRRYKWDDIDFQKEGTSSFVVRDNITKNLLFGTLMDNILFYEQVEMEEEDGNESVSN